MTRCRSPFCITDTEGVRGRKFEPAEDTTGLPLIWCAYCVKLGTQLEFYTKQTATMIRGKYNQYRPDKLPKNVANMLRMFATDILSEFGEEL